MVQGLGEPASSPREHDVAAPDGDLEPLGVEEPFWMTRDDPTRGADEREPLAGGRQVLHVVDPKLRVARLFTNPQVRFDGTGSGQGCGEEVWMCSGRRPREIDDAEQAPVLGIVDGCCSAGPAMHDLAEMLRRMNLNRMVRRQCGPDGVRTGTGLVPDRTLDEVHHIGRGRADPHVTVEPQEQTLGVTDDDQVLALGSDPPEPATDQRRARLERMGLPTLDDLTPVREEGGRSGRLRD